MKYMIAVCTCNRNELLAECLKSLAALHIPPQVDVMCVVVDNNANKVAETLVKEQRSSFPFPLLYCHQSESGIPFARNMALDVAQSNACDFLAFIDDDETADQNWLSGLIDAQKLIMPM